MRTYRVKHLAAGTKVKVEFDGEWYAATVLAGALGLHYVHYEEEGPEFPKEWVAAERIRKP
jgi:hypothetical protein